MRATASVSTSGLHATLRRTYPRPSRPNAGPFERATRACSRMWAAGSSPQPYAERSIDLVGGRAGERLGAVPALEQERLAAGGAREAVAQDVDLTREDERRVGRDLRRRRGHGLRVRPLGLLLDRQLTPIVETGDHGGICLYNGLGRLYHGWFLWVWWVHEKRAYWPRRVSLTEGSFPC